jgi:hypothetical protein
VRSESPAQAKDIPRIFHLRAVVGLMIHSSTDTHRFGFLCFMPPRGRKRKTEDPQDPEHPTPASAIPSSSIVAEIDPSSSSSSRSTAVAVEDSTPAPAPIPIGISNGGIRRSQRRKNLEEGKTFDPPKEKSMTLGQHLQQERDRAAEELMESDALSKYETFVNYEKEDVINDLSLEERPGFRGQLYFTPSGPKQAAVLFIPLSVGAHPKLFSHICNSSSLQWNLEKMHISSSSTFGLPNVVLVFVCGQHLEGISSSTGTLFKCLGLLGVQSISSGPSGPGKPYQYRGVTLVFDYVIRKKELEEQFGGNVMKCKKNRYGCSLCE